MASTKDVLGKIAKSNGESSVVRGNQVTDVERIPTGIFAFDLASGGGFPIGKMSVVYGPESSGKTNLCLKAVSQYQRLFPKMEIVFFDIENSFDNKWAKKMGVDTENIHVIKPDYAEQVVDQMDALLMAEDIGLILVDSLAAMQTIREIENSAEKANVGGSTIPVTNMAKTIIRRQSEARKRQHYPTVLCVNQTRTNIGVMFGDPETMPCGAAVRFMSGLTVRVYGKNEIDKAVNPDLPSYKNTTAMIKKHKVPIVKVKSEYRMAMIPHGNLRVGDCDDFNLMFAYMKEIGMMQKLDKGWVLTVTGEEFKTLVACKEHLEEHPDLVQEIKQEIIDDAIERLYQENETE